MIRIIDMIEFSVSRVAIQMSWMSRRKTKKVEDMAHPMIEIFDVSLDLLSDEVEGEKAFNRLQEAIINKRPGESMFAWKVRKEESICMCNILLINGLIVRKSS